MKKFPARFLVRILASTRQRGGEREFNISAATASAENPQQTNGASITLANVAALNPPTNET